MKNVNKTAVVARDRCVGCQTCRNICPTQAIAIVNKKAEVNDEKCMGCSNCEQRCPVYAISMAARTTAKIAGVDVGKHDADKIREICNKAQYHPEQVICFCTGTRAGEIAAAILEGARSPEDVAVSTGARTGCKVLCIEPVLRLLSAAGIEPPKPNGYQWCGHTVTLWTMSEEVRRKFDGDCYHLENDKKFIEKTAKAPWGEGDCK